MINQYINHLSNFSKVPHGSPDTTSSPIADLVSGRTFSQHQGRCGIHRSDLTGLMHFPMKSWKIPISFNDLAGKEYMLVIVSVIDFTNII